MHLLTTPSDGAHIRTDDPAGSGSPLRHSRCPCNFRHRWLAWLGGVIVLWSAAVSSLLAHDPGLSSIRVTITPTEVETIFTIHFADLETVAPELDVNHDGRLDAAEFAHARPRLIEIARQELEIAVGNHTLSILPADADARVDLIGNNNLQMTVRFRLHGAVVENRFTITSRLIGQLPPGHRQFVEVLLGPDGQGIGEGFLVAAADQLSFDLPPLASPAAGVSGATAVEPPRQIHYGEFFLLGVNHLLTGYDHLLFLAGLLIVCRSLLKAFQMLTLFTIAHSVTLTLVALDLIKPSSVLVEPTIAASIAYIGIENILRPRADLGWRGALTFVFGLVHGLGFASVLKELGVGIKGASGVFQPLLYFSLGLETTQLGLAALAFPFLLWLRTKPMFIRFWIPVFSGLIALAGCYWFFERTLATGR